MFVAVHDQPVPLIGQHLQQLLPVVHEIVGATAVLRVRFRRVMHDGDADLLVIALLQRRF